MNKRFMAFCMAICMIGLLIFGNRTVSIASAAHVARKNTATLSDAEDGTLKDGAVKGNTDDESDFGTPSDGEIIGSPSNAADFYHEEVVEGYKVTLSAKKGILPADTTVTIKKVSEVDGADISSLLADKVASPSEIKETVAFDITFYLNGKEIEPENGSVQVSIDVSKDITNGHESAQDISAQVFHIENKDSVEEVNCNMNSDTEISYDAKKFTTYGIILSSSEYHEIYTAEDFQNIKNDLSGEYKLMNDINISTVGNWIPIGTSKEPFSGSLEGNNHYISDLSMNASNFAEKGSDNIYAGLFGYISTGAYISNLVLDNFSITESSEDLYVSTPDVKVGALCGCADDGFNISNIKVTNLNIYIDDNRVKYVGGVVGYSGSATFDHCSVSGKIEVAGNNGYVGGICGIAILQSVINSINEAEITFRSGTTDVYAGGIAGLCNAEKCVNKGNVSVSAEGFSPSTAGSTYSIAGGGIAGTGKSAKDCYNIATINVNAVKKQNNMYAIPSAGGIIGMIEEKNNEIATSYNIGAVHCENHNTYKPVTYSGGIVGRFNKGTKGSLKVTNCYFIDSLANAIGSANGILSNVNSCSMALLQQQSTFTGFNFSSVWQMGISDYFCPILQGVDEETNTTTISLNQSNAVIKVGESLQLEANVTTNNANTMVTWTSSDQNIIQVDADGKVLGISIGEAAVYATVNGIQAECKITVVNSGTTGGNIGVNPIYPKNRSAGITGVPVSTFYLKCSLDEEIQNYDIKAGAVHLYEYDTDKEIYKTEENQFKPGICDDITVNGKNITIKSTNMVAGLKPATKYYVTIDPGLFVTKGGKSSGISSKGEWTFTTYAGLNPCEIQLYSYENQYLESLYVEKGIRLGSIKLPNMERNGYKFLGWYMNYERTMELQNDMVITGTTAIYAKWIENSPSGSDSSSQTSSSWTKSNNGWMCTYNGKQCRNGVYSLYWKGVYGTYYFNENGIMVPGWVAVNGKMRYFGEDGAEITTDYLRRKLTLSRSTKDLGTYDYLDFWGNVTNVDKALYDANHLDQYLNAFYDAGGINEEYHAAINNDAEGSCNFLYAVINEMCNTKEINYVDILDKGEKAYDIYKKYFSSGENDPVLDILFSLPTADAAKINYLFINYQNNINTLEQYQANVDPGSELYKNLDTMITEYKKNFSEHMSDTEIMKLITEIEKPEVRTLNANYLVDKYGNDILKKAGISVVKMAFPALDAIYHGSIQVLNVLEPTSIPLGNVFYGEIVAQQAAEALKKAEDKMLLPGSGYNEMINYVSAFNFMKEVYLVQYKNMIDYYKNASDNYSRQNEIDMLTKRISELQSMNFYSYASANN